MSIKSCMYARSVYRQYRVIGRKVPRLQVAFARRASSSTSAFPTTTLRVHDEIQEANRRCRNELEIRNTGSVGWGLFATRQIQKGERVMRARVLSSSTERCSHSVQIDWNKHVLMDLPARFINHSCGDANVGIRDNDLGAFDFFALCDVGEGQELLFDYETSEYEVSTPFQCNCGSSSCRGVLSGFRHNKQVIREKYGDFIADFLK